MTTPRLVAVGSAELEELQSRTNHQLSNAVAGLADLARRDGAGNSPSRRYSVHSTEAAGEVGRSSEECHAQEVLLGGRG